MCRYQRKKFCSWGDRMKPLLKPPFAVEWPESDKKSSETFLSLFTDSLQTLKIVRPSPSSEQTTTTKKHKTKKNSYKSIKKEETSVDEQKLDTGQGKNRKRKAKDASSKLNHNPPKKLMKKKTQCQINEEESEKHLGSPGSSSERVLEKPTSSSWKQTGNFSGLSSRGSAESSTTGTETLDRRIKRDIWKGFSVGMSSVLRDLQNKSLSMVLFDRNALRPSAFGHFIGAAAATTGTNAYAINGLSERCSKLMNLKSVLAIGLPKSVLEETKDSEKEMCFQKIIQEACLHLKPVIFALNYPTKNEDGDRKNVFAPALTFVPGETKKLG